MYTNTIQTSIQEFIEETFYELEKIHADVWSSKPDPARWSKKEILGHLIDSAQTNIRRLIVSQYQQNEKIRYRQNEWVAYSNYQDMPIPELLIFWKLINLHYHRVSQNIPKASLAFTCDTGQEEVSLVTLGFLIRDYWGHQQHHLGQIFS
jgi:hypothetical protein